MGNETLIKNENGNDANRLLPAVQRPKMASETLQLLTKEEIIEAVSTFFDQTDMEATGNMNEPEDKYMVNEFGRIKRTLLNRLKMIVNHQVRHKE